MSAVMTAFILQTQRTASMALAPFAAIRRDWGETGKSGLKIERVRKAPTFCESFSTKLWSKCESFLENKEIQNIMTILVKLRLCYPLNQYFHRKMIGKSFQHQ
jgi:hypothetical protein